MNTIDYIGKKVVATTNCERDADGYWSVVMTVEHFRSVDLENWESKSLTLKVIDKDLDKAVGKGYQTVAAYLNTVDGNLFAEDDMKKEQESNVVESVENT